jgi:hypothetical protein
MSTEYAACIGRAKKACKILVKFLIGRDHFGDLGVGGRMILK